ncbi:MAG: transposase [Methylovirgula sp.]|uniref:transposase n=1 Tax=Methylovirgula sp. TaxID=1978224 RepID=UPI0030764524
MIEAVPVAERLEGAPVRLHRRWSDELKEQVVAESFLPGANVSAIARRVGIDPSQLFSWRKALRRGGARMVAPDAAVDDKARSGPVIEIVVGDAVIRADAMVDEAHLRRVVRAVRSA